MKQQERIYHIGNCPVCCDYGRMEVLIDTLSSKCFVMCEECSLEFASIDDYKKASNGKRVFFGPEEKIPEVRLASLEEIKDTEWYSFITDEF